MTLVAIEGFDTFGTTNGDAGSADVVTGIEAKYTGSYGQGADVRVYDGWGSGKAFAFGRDGSADDNYALIPIGSAVTTVIVGFAYKPRAAPLAANYFLSLYDINEDKDHVTFMCLHGNTLRVKRGTFGTTALGYVHDCFRPHRWVYFEVKATINDSTGAVEVKINGVQKLNLTGIDTNDGATTPQVTHIKLQNGDGWGDSSLGCYLHDDLYICTTAGSVNNDFLGPNKVESIYPDAEGDNIDFTPSTGTDNSALVDENPRNDDVDYNQSGTTGHYDLLTAVNLSTITGGIKGIQLNTDAKVTDASPLDLINKIKSSTTEDEASAQQVSDDAEYTTFYDIWEEDPATSTAWTVSGVNAVQIGYEVG